MSVNGCTSTVLVTVLAGDAIKGGVGAGDMADKRVVSLLVFEGIRGFIWFIGTFCWLEHRMKMQSTNVYCMYTEWSI
jgi:hypothetical protein